MGGGSFTIDSGYFMRFKTSSSPALLGLFFLLLRHDVIDVLVQEGLREGVVLLVDQLDLILLLFLLLLALHP